MLYDTELVSGQLEIIRPVTSCSPNPFVYEGYYEGSKDGIVCAAVSPTNNPYTIVWSDGYVGVCRYDLNPGTYSAEIHFENGCEKSLSSVDLCCCSNPTDNPAHPDIPFCSGTPTGNPEPVYIEGATLNGTTSATSNDGEIHLILSGTCAVSYDWSVPGLPNSGDLTGLAPGTYCVTLTNLCLDQTESRCFTLDNCGEHPINSITGIVTAQNSGSCNGSIDLNTGSVPANSYQLHWSNGGSSEPLANLCGGVYTVTVTSFTGCSATSSYTVCNPTTPKVVRFDLKGIKDCAAPGGTASVEVEGGTLPYTYVWAGPYNNGSNPPATIISHEQTANNILHPGDYKVTVTDACNNSVVKVIRIPCNCDYKYFPSNQRQHVFAEEDSYFIEFDAEDYCYDEGDSRLFLSRISDPGVNLSTYECGYANANPFPTYEVIWPDNTTSTLVAIGPCENYSQPIFVLNGPTEWRPDHADTYYITFTDDYGCQFSECVTFREESIISDLEYEPLIKYQPSFYDPSYMVRALCRECSVCGTDCEGQNQVHNNCGAPERLSYTSGGDVNNPCKGGVIRCPVTNATINVPSYLSGVPFIDYDNPHYFEGTCRYDVGCLFPEGTLGFQGIKDPIYVETTMVVECDGGGDPDPDDCPIVYHWYENEPCRYDGICAETGELVVEYELDDAAAPICVMYPPAPDGSNPVPQLVQICLLDGQTVHAPIAWKDKYVSDDEIEGYLQTYGRCDQYGGLIGPNDSRNNRLKITTSGPFKSEVYPTIFSNSFNLEIDAYKRNDRVELFITNVIGEVVYSRQYPLTDEHNLIKVQLNELKEEGVYFVTVKNSDGVVNNHKIVKISAP